MARSCEICEKGPQVGHWRKLLRGHYNVTAKRRFRPNLQPFNKNGKKMKVCTSCLRTEKKHMKSTEAASVKAEEKSEASK